MHYTPDRVVELLNANPWEPGISLRLFWVRYSEGSRSAFAERLAYASDTEAIIPLVVRNNAFFNANAILSDVQHLFELNRSTLESYCSPSLMRITVVVLGKNDFRLIQCSSPITLPNWFPVMSGTETFFKIADLGLTTELDMLDCKEARVDHISELVFQLEQAIVGRLADLNRIDPARLQRFIVAAHGGNPVADCSVCLQGYEEHLGRIVDPRAYRPNAAADSKFLVARLLKLVLGNSPKDIAACAKVFAGCFIDANPSNLSPTLFAVMLRTAAKMDGPTANWHAILMAFYQAYQLMNGAAHAGEYPPYSVALQFANSVNLRTFFVEAREYVERLV